MNKKYSNQKLGTALIGLFVIALLAVLPFTACAQTFTPSEPQFTIKYVDNSYTKPKTYTTNPYTGEVFANAGEQVVNRSLYVTIKNQPFTPYMDLSGNLTQLYYYVLWKPHYGDLWNGHDNPQSNGEYTEVAIASGDCLPSKGLIDVKVQVLIGYWFDSYVVYGEFSMGMAMQGYYDHHDFFGEKYNGTVIQTYDLSNGKITYTTIPIDPTSGETPTEPPTDNSTSTANPSDGAQQTGNPPTDNPVANNAADSFSLGNLKLGIGDVAGLAAIAAIAGALVTLVVTRRFKHQTLD
jgi:hypothetical protein